MRIGIFGGTFDPPHLGHLVVAQDACSALSLDRVLFVVAAAPPHKRGRQHTAATLRLEMLRAALAGDDRFEACDLELRRPGLSYTVDTIRQLREEWPGDELILLIGADQARELHTWHAPDEIARLATIVALSREGDRVTDTRGGLPVRSLHVTRLDISATDIRRRVAAGRPIRYLVPDAVQAIIRRESLYTGTSAAVPVSSDRPGGAGV